MAKRFGISQATYYLWRKKAGAPGGSSRVRSTSRALALTGEMAGTIRAQVRSAILAMLPQLIKDEVAAAFGTVARRRNRR